MGLIVYLLSFGSSSVRAMKLEFYLNCPCSHLCTSYADLITRRIGREETVQGRQYAQAKARRDPPPPPPPPPQLATGPVPTGNQPSVKRKRRSSWSSYWMHFARTSPMTVFVLITGGYVHAASSIQRREAQQHFLLFTIGSTVFKLCMQELAKWVTLKKAVKDIRIMCVAIGIPTVLIDTQIRLVLQSVQSNSATLSGTLLMALIEIAMRLAKVWMVKLEIHRLDVAHASINAVVPALSTAWDTGGTQTALSQNEVARKKRKIMAFYSTELYSDMSAEYIAIGCSASIVFFSSSHPKYTINGGQPSTGGDSSSSASGSHASDLTGLPSWYQLLTLLLQVGVEIVVDWLSTMFEVSGGVDFADLLQHRAYIAAFFVSLAIINIQSSASLYALW